MRTIDKAIMIMKSRFQLFVITILLMELTGCDFLSKKTAVSVESPYTNLMLINCQDLASFEDARIAGSVHMTQKDYKEKTKDWNKSNTVIVYCANYLCTASDHLAKALVNDGFSDVRVYHGGIQEWYQLSQKDAEHYPVEGSLKQPWLKSAFEKPEDEKSEITGIEAIQLAQLLSQAKK